MSPVSRIDMIQENKNLLLYSTTGASMFPFVRWNDCILVKKVPTETIQLGDVVVFESDQSLKVCHRIVKVEEKDGILWFQTRGDRNKFYDAPVRQEKILGRVIAVRRKMNLIELSKKRKRYLLYKFNCFFASCIFFMKKIAYEIKNMFS